MLEDPTAKQKMIDQFKQSKKVIILPEKSPILKKLDPEENLEQLDNSMDSDDVGVGITYPNQLRKNVFEIRVFNGNLHETKQEAVNSMLKAKM